MTISNYIDNLAYLMQSAVYMYSVEYLLSYR